MNAVEYHILKKLDGLGGKCMLSNPSEKESQALDRLIERGHVEHSVHLSNDNLLDRYVVYSITTAGHDAFDEYRTQRSERRWTRGLAIAAVVISLFTLLLELDDRGYLGGMFSRFKSIQSAAQSTQD